MLPEASTPAHLALSTSKQRSIWERERTHNINQEKHVAVRSMSNTPSFDLILEPQSVKFVLITRTLHWMGDHSPQGTWVRYKVVWCCCSRPSGEVIPAKDITGAERCQGLLYRRATHDHPCLYYASLLHRGAVSLHTLTLHH